MPQVLRVMPKVGSSACSAAAEKVGAITSTKLTWRSTHTGLRTSAFSVVCVNQRSAGCDR